MRGLTLVPRRTDIADAQVARCLLSGPRRTREWIAFAQSDLRQERSKPPEEVKAIKERVADWLKQCLNDWDRATHMTKGEWRTTCHRVAADRGKFLLENPDPKPVSDKGRRR